MTDHEIEAIGYGEVADDAAQAMLGAVDDLVDHGTVSTAVWDDLARHFTDHQRMDLVFTIGGYYLLAIAVNTFGIEDEKP